MALSEESKNKIVYLASCALVVTVFLQAISYSRLTGDYNVLSERYNGLAASYKTLGDNFATFETSDKRPVQLTIVGSNGELKALPDYINAINERLTKLEATGLNDTQKYIVTDIKNVLNQ